MVTRQQASTIVDAYPSLARRHRTSQIRMIIQVHGGVTAAHPVGVMKWCVLSRFVRFASFACVSCGCAGQYHCRSSTPQTRVPLQECLQSQYAY